MTEDNKSNPAPGGGGCYVVLVAAGRGQRFGGEIPKQYRMLAGRPVIRHSIDVFASMPEVAGIQPVIHPDDRDLFDAAVHGADVMPPVPGGSTRQASVRAGLDSLASAQPEKVLIHDAARPFPDPAAVLRLIAQLEDTDGALLACPVVDTLKRAPDGRVAETVPRDGLWRAQTPQGFRYGAIVAAHRAAPHENFTDDAAIAEHAGLGVAIVESDEGNFKITTEADLTMAERRLASTGGTPLVQTRVGTGFDVHRFGPGDHVWLGGVKVPHDRALVGHSDADVALHALTDAVLGAIADGDIGAHFSDKDPRWQGASSDRFLAHAVDLLRGRGGRLIALDLTVICERPKVRPYHDAIRERVAGIAGLPVGRVSIKATTTEGLGFTGRGEGIAAQAVATVVLPDDA